MLHKIPFIYEGWRGYLQGTLRSFLIKSLRRFRCEGHCALSKAVDEFGRSRNQADDLIGSAVLLPER